MDNYEKKIHSNLNTSFRSHLNPNWKAIIRAISESDKDVGELIEEVRNQFFISTASRPYLDRLGSNVKVNRPPIVGMDDETYRKYIPIMSYSPKQVKLIINQLLDIFFFKERTTAFIESNDGAPFYLEDGWELEYLVDGIYSEKILFSKDDFLNIESATAEEVVSVINRQAKRSFAIVLNDRSNRVSRIQIFTNTLGSTGSVMLTGGRANIFMKFLGTIFDAGSTDKSIWEITKVGDTVKFKNISAEYVGLNKIQAGDIAIIDANDEEAPGNSGSFEILEVNVSEQYFTYINLWAEPKILDNNLEENLFVRFVSHQKSVVFTRNNRAILWEVQPGEIVVEMPATPPVVRRSVSGSAHINGPTSTMLSLNSSTSITLDSVEDWPESGVIILEPKYEIRGNLNAGFIANSYTSSIINGCFDLTNQTYSYSGKSGNTLLGISPELPRQSGILTTNIKKIFRFSETVYVETESPHLLRVGQDFSIEECSGPNFNKSWTVSEVLNSNRFAFRNIGGNSTGSGGFVKSEYMGLLSSGSKAYLSSAMINTDMFGPYIYDFKGQYVLSSYVGKTNQVIEPGNIYFNLEINGNNNIPNEVGIMFFNYGLNNQEGPIKMFSKSTDTTLLLDPSYVFTSRHEIGSQITVIRRKGAISIDQNGEDIGTYITDPQAARIVLQRLIESVKSAGTYLKYIVRYPHIFYSDFDLYKETEDPLD